MEMMRLFSLAAGVGASWGPYWLVFLRRVGRGGRALVGLSSRGPAMEHPPPSPRGGGRG